MDISPASRPRLRPALASLLVIATTLVAAPALFVPAAGAVRTGATSAAGHARAHTTTKSARFVLDIRNVQGALNQCRGPVAWNSRGEGAPWLLFEHDYCGGAWVLSTRAGDVLQIRNGPLAGTWRATGRVRLVSRGAMVSTTKGLGYLVVQTCVPGTARMRLVGFDRVR